MADMSQSMQCLNCARTDEEIPLVAVQYKGGRNWICSECLPILIHHAHKLADKLAPPSKSGDE